MKLRQKLDEYRGCEIAVIMIDGRCFKGTLVDFDDRILILTGVAETTNEEIDWTIKESMAGSETPTLEWHQVALPESILLIDHILRIWPWRGAEEKPTSEYKQVMSRADNVPVYLLF